MSELIFRVNPYNYVYQYKDHLGNIRLSYADRDKDGVVDVLRRTGIDNRGAVDLDGDGDLAHEIKEVKDYYPFGLQMKYGVNSANSLITGRKHLYGYNGKEENDELGLGWLDYSARNYDASLGRWMNIDPHAYNYNDFSPYNYVGANPIIRTDPDGKDWRDKIMGAVIGAVTNVIPGTTNMRSLYTPNDADDYNNTLRGSDIVASGVGAIMIVSGATKAAGGTAVAAAGAAASTTGVGAVVGAPTASAGAAVAAEGALEAGAGAVIVANAVKNTAAGYNYGDKSTSESSGNSTNNNSGKRRKNRIPDKGEPNTVSTNSSGTTSKKYGPDGNVQKEYNKGHGNNAPKKEQVDHIHDYKPNPKNPTGRGTRQPGRKPKKNELIRDFEIKQGS